MGNKNSAKLTKQDLNRYSQHTLFSDNEIKEWFKSFHRDCPNGYLTIEDFNIIYRQYFPNGDPSAFARYIFKCFDKNNDGKVSFQEFLLALNTTAKSSQQDQIKWAFDLYDTDKDGSISRDDMFNIVKSIYQMIGPMMVTSDDESTPEKRTNKIFNQFDTNRDGLLSVEEFAQIAYSDRSILQVLESSQIPSSSAMLMSATPIINNSSIGSRP